MSFLDRDFAHLRELLAGPFGLNPTHSEPLYYFAYPATAALDVKRKLASWTAALRSDGFRVERLSMADVLWEIIDHSGRWDEWLINEPDADVVEVNEAVRSVVNRAITARVQEQATQPTADKSVLLVTEVELLHPYFRARTVENSLKKVTMPVVIFYPGRRAGQYSLHFLDFYSPDPNYRSTVVGGGLQ